MNVAIASQRGRSYFVKMATTISPYCLLLCDQATLPSKVESRDFPGGAVVTNPPTNAGDTGSIPGRELDPTYRGATKPTCSGAHVPQLESPRTATTEPACHN